MDAGLIYTVPPSLFELDGDPLGAEKPRVLVAPVKQREGKPLIEGVVKRIDEASHGMVGAAAQSGLFTGKRGETHSFPLNGRIILLVGVGGGDTAEDYRRGLAKAAKQLVEKHEEVAVDLRDLDDDTAGEAMIGFLLGAYLLDYFKSEKKAKLRRVYYAGRLDANRVKAIVEGVYLARDIANAPPNDLYPERLAEKLKDIFSSLPNVDVEVFDYERLVKEGFGGIVNVGRGSRHKPVLVKIHYKGGVRKIALVGKTLVFDSGGVDLKQPSMMEDMYADKAGGAAVAGILWAAAKLGLQLDLYGLLGAAINAVDGESYLPSDVIRVWDGTRVDVGNTDAEGRLVIGDAIAYAAKEIGADVVIDMATLTGAAVVALGTLIAAIFTRDKQLEETLTKASNETGELIWPLPMADVYVPLLSAGARLGDVNNVYGRYGGAIYAALFLERFSHGKRFVHLDIAGPGIGAGEASQVAPEYWPDKKAPGYGVRLLVSTLEKLEKT